MSPGAARKGVNLRAPATAKTQGGSNVTRVDWTPIFARGKVRIYVCSPEAATRNPQLPAKLTDAQNLAKFIRYVLPAELAKMKAKYRWADLPRVVVHDKASYMVTWAHDRLNVVFAGALAEAGFTSWVGGNHAPTNWLVKKWGDVYPHETLISHIRRLVDEEFTCRRLTETLPQFSQRMQRVEDHLNSDDFAAPDGTGLLGLAKELRGRCQTVLLSKGERVPK
jgi:hypothetical protein